MSTIIRFGLDLAKNSFSVCGVDAHEKVRVRTTLKRRELLAYFVQQPPALVAMESGSGAHHWARELRRQGHDVRIIDARQVAPYRQQGRVGKNDANDAAAICEAAGRPHMRFVPIKSVEQQAVLVVHRLRSSAVADHTPHQSDARSAGRVWHRHRARRRYLQGAMAPDSSAPC